MTPGPGALGVDPAPGDAGVADALARRLQDAASELAGLRDRLTGTGQPGPDAWAGEAARALTASVEALLPRVEGAAGACGTAARALRVWAAVLQERQAEGRRLADRAEEALLGRERALAVLRAATEAVWGLSSPPGSAAEGLAALRAAHGAVDAAEAELARLRAAGAALRAQHDDDARATARAVAEAAALAPEQPGLLSRAAGGVDGLLDAHANVLAELGDVLAEAAGVVGLVAVPVAVVAAPAGALAAAGGLALAGGGLLLHAAGDRGGADVPASVYAYDAVGVATAGAGGLAVRAVGRVADLVGAGATAEGALEGWDGSSDDGAYQHFVPEEGLERDLHRHGGLLGGALAAGVSAVRHGREKDRAARCGSAGPR